MPKNVKVALELDRVEARILRYMLENSHYFYEVTFKDDSGKDSKSFLSFRKKREELGEAETCQRCSSLPNK